MVTWATFDSSWVHLVDEVKFGSVLDKVRKLDLRIVLSSHLPMAHDMNEHLLKVIASLPSAKPFVAPNQTIFSQIANQITALQGDSGR